MIFAKVTSEKLPGAILLAQKIRPTLWRASRSALSSCGYESAKRIAKFIRTQGGGSWPKSHPSSLSFRRNHEGLWIKRFRKKEAYAGMASFVRYTLRGLATEFGFAIEKQPRGFNRFLEKIATRMQKTYATRPTEDMRKMFGSQRGSSKDVPGEDFFPIKRNTNLLHRARELEVVDIVSAVVREIFEQKYGASFERNERKLENF